jgi:hypothetical protein
VKKSRRIIIWSEELKLTDRSNVWLRFMMGSTRRWSPIRVPDSEGLERWSPAVSHSVYCARLIRLGDTDNSIVYSEFRNHGLPVLLWQ